MSGYPTSVIVANSLGIEGQWFSIPARLLLIIISLALILRNSHMLFNALRDNIFLFFVIIFLFYRQLEYYFLGGTPLLNITVSSILLTTLPLLACLTIEKPNEILVSKICVCLLGLGLSLLSVGSYFNLFEEFSLLFTGRLSLVVLNPISISIYSGILFICAFRLFRDNLLSIWAFTIIIVLSLFCIETSETRGPVIALGAVMVIHFLKRSFSKNSFVIPLFILTLLTVILTTHPPLYQKQIIEQYDAAMALDPVKGPIAQSAEEANKGQEGLRAERRLFNDNSVKERLVSLQQSAEAFTGNYLIGIHNYSVYGVNHYPHNIIFEILMNFGLILGVPFIFHISKRLFNVLAKNIEKQTIFDDIFILMLVVHMFSGSIYNSAIFLTMTFIVKHNHGIQK